MGKTLTRALLVGTLAASVGLAGCSRLPFSPASAQGNQAAKGQAKAQKPGKGDAAAQGQAGAKDLTGKALKKPGKKGGNGAAATQPTSTRTP